MTLYDRAFSLLQRLTPTHALSRVMRAVAGLKVRWCKNLLIRIFMRLYRVDLADAQIRDPQGYACFNAFFTRALRPNARPLPTDPRAVISPVDGYAGWTGDVHTGWLLQTKGMAYQVGDLLGGDEALAAPYLGGQYATFYLAPANYHRVHMPVPGVLRETRHVPGRLFGVNPASVRSIPRLFTRNERVLCCFDTAAGPLAVIFIGAFCVGGISTAWGGRVNRHTEAESWPASGDGCVRLARGAELGRFHLGSSVVLLFGPGAVDWAATLSSGEALRMGERIGLLQPGG